MYTALLGEAILSWRREGQPRGCLSLVLAPAWSTTVGSAQAVCAGVAACTCQVSVSTVTGSMHVCLLLLWE